MQQVSKPHYVVQRYVNGKPVTKEELWEMRVNNPTIDRIFYKTQNRIARSCLINGIPKEKKIGMA